MYFRILWATRSSVLFCFTTSMLELLAFVYCRERLIIFVLIFVFVDKNNTDGVWYGAYSSGNWPTR